MTTRTSLLWLAALAVLSLGSVGCDTYHYFDVKVVFDETSLPIDAAGNLKFCEVVVSGADKRLEQLPTESAQSSNSKVVCPIGSNYPTLGTFEYTTFTDSGKLTFTFQGYYDTPAMSSFQCATGSIDFNADSTITQSGTMMVSSGPNTCISTTSP